MKAYSAADIRRVLTMPEVIAAVRAGFIRLCEGKAVLPERAQIDVTPSEGTTLLMPGYLPEEGELAVKIVSVFPRNRTLGLPVINALIVVVDTGTGQPAAVMDGASITAMRTGAASGLATDLLARTDASTVAILGAGVQGRTQLAAVAAVRDLERVWIFDTDAERARAFAAEMAAEVEAPIRVAETAEQAAGAADVLCTVTTSPSPIFADSCIRPGTHINAVGVFKPHLQEIPAETVVRARVFVDSLDAAMEEAGDLLVPMEKGLIGKEHILAELGEVATGSRPGRRSTEEVTLFKSVGLAVQDVTTAALVIRKAEELGLGTEIEL
jgi:ornithine cyclodeaminase